jgi:diguanylate cyclase (GGDEF)-like protein
MTSARDTELAELHKELAHIRQGLGSLVRHNERIWAGFRQIEVGMIAAHSLREVIETLTNQIPALFPHVTCVSLACLDPDFELTRMLQTANDEAPPDSFRVIGTDRLSALGMDTGRPRLGPCDSETARLLFPHSQQLLASMALVPLRLRGRTIGCLNQASADAGHFSKTSATELIEHLAAIAALCIDNAVINERLKRDGLTDALTGIANRRWFERRLNEEIVRRERHGQPLSCILVDIDRFKEINDNHGHGVGDRVLQAVAATLARSLRAGDVLVRYGGDEFCLLLPATPATLAAVIAERMREGVAALRFADPSAQSLRVTVSAGLACLDGPPEPHAPNLGAWLVERADGALYQAKQSGRNKVVVATAV